MWRKSEKTKNKTKQKQKQKILYKHNYFCLSAKPIPPNKITLMVVCHKLVLKSVSYPKIVKNTPILIEQSIACNVYT